MKSTPLALLSTALVACAAYFGYVENVEWALNLLKFYVWVVCLPFMLLVLVGVGPMTKAQREEAAKKMTPTFVYSLTTVTLLCVVGTMVAYGSFFTAAALLLCVTISAILRKAVKTV